MKTRHPRNLAAVAAALSGLVLLDMLLWSVTARAEIVQTNWARQLGLGTLRGALFSPQGDTVLTYGGFGAALWSVNRDTVLRQFHGHQGAVNRAVLSPDGTRLLTGSDDRTVKLWSVAEGTLLRTFQGHTGRIRSVAFAPDGQTVLTGGDDSSVRMWSVEGPLLWAVTGFTGAITDVAFSPDGRQVLTGGADRTAGLWSARDGTRLRTFVGHQGSVESVAFSPDGTTVATGGGWPDYSVRLWSARSGALQRILSGHNGNVISLAFSPDGTKVLSGSYDASLRLWSASDGALLRSISGHRNALNSVAFSPDGTLLLTSSDDQTAKAWWIGGGPWQWNLSGHSASVTSVACSPDGAQALTGNLYERFASLWSVPKESSTRIFEGHSWWVMSVAFSPDGSLALTGGDETAKLWRTGAGTLVRTFAGHATNVWSVAFSPDGTQVLTGSEDATAKLWRTTDGTLQRTFRGHSGVVTSVAYSPDGSQVLTGSGDKTAKLWSVGDGTLRRTFEGHGAGIWSVAFSPDGRQVLTGGGDWIARLYSATDGADLRKFAGHSNQVLSVAFSPDGRQVLTGSMDQTAKLWSAADGTLLRTFLGHADRVNSVAVSPDGTRVLTASADGTVLVWDISEFQAVTIVVQPAGQTNIAGGTAIFKVSATGSEPLAYQWRKDGTDLARATNSVLVISPLAPADAGSYRVSVSNRFGAVLSAEAVLAIANQIHYVTNQASVATLAGSGEAGSVDGSGSQAQFNSPNGVRVDSRGNIYLADSANHRIRKVTPDGTVTTLAGAGVAGYADGPANLARFNHPLGVCADAKGNVYVADSGNHRIRKIDASGVVSTMGGTGEAGYVNGLAKAAQFNRPKDLVLDLAGDLFISDFNNHAVRKLTQGGYVKPFAGNGTPGDADGYEDQARFNQPAGLAFDWQWNLYVTEWGGQRVRKIDQGGKVSTMAGKGLPGYVDGMGTNALFNHPDGVATDPQGYLYVADNGNQAIRRISPAGWVETVAGTGVAGYADGLGAKAQFSSPSGIGVDSAGRLYVAEAGNQRVRKIVTGEPVTITRQPESRTVVAGVPLEFSVSATGTPPLFYQWLKNGTNLPGAISNVFFLAAAGLADAGSYRVSVSNVCDPVLSAEAVLAVTSPVRFTTNRVTVSTLAGTGQPGDADGAGTDARFDRPNGGSVDDQGNVYIADSANHRIRKVTPLGVVSTVAGNGVPGYLDGPASQAMFSQPLGVCADAAGNVWVADTGNSRIRRIDAAGVVSTVAGNGLPGYADGAALEAQFNFPNDLVADPHGSLFVIEFNNHTVRKIAGGMVGTWVGNGTAGYADGLGASARLNQPSGIAHDRIDRFGEVRLLVSEWGNQRVRRISTDGLVVTLAGTGVPGYVDGPGKQAQFRNPDGLAVDPQGWIYVADNGNQAIRRINPSTLQVETIAGTGTAGYADGPGASARFSAPAGLGIDRAGDLYVADDGNDRVRKIMLGDPVTITGQPQSQMVVAGTGMAFFVTATGTPPLFYQWRKNGTDLPGAIWDTFYLASAGLADAGSYRVSVSNRFGEVLSAEARLTVTSPVHFVTNRVTVSTLAGTGQPGATDGAGASAEFNHPNGGFVDDPGNVYIADSANHRIRKVTPQGDVSTVAGTGVPGYLDGVASQAMFNQPLGVCGDAQGNLWVADTGNSRIRRIDASGMVSTVAGCGLSGYADGANLEARFDFPNDLVADDQGNLYVTEFNNHTVRQIVGGMVSTWVGNGTAGYVDGSPRDARLNQPGGIARDGQGNLYVSEWGGQRIRKINPSGAVSTVAGDGFAGYLDGPAAQARFRNPDGLVVDAAGWIYVADNGNQAIRRISPDGWVETVAGMGAIGYADGPGANAQFASPSGIGMDTAGNLYVADWGNQRVRQVTLNRSLTVAVPPRNAGVVAGREVTLRALAYGTGPVRYQWYKNGVEIAGATQAWLTVTGARMSDTGSYTVVVSDASGSLTSTAAVLTVRDQPGPALVIRWEGNALVLDYWCQSARGTVAIYWSEQADWSHAPVMPWYTGAIPASGQGSVVIPDRFAPWRFFNLLESPETAVPVKPDRQP